MKNSSIAFLFLFLITIGCKQSTSVNTGNPQPATEAKRFQINQTKTCGGLDVTIGEVAIESGKITAGLTVSNKSKNVLSFYPDQKNVVIGKRQIDANMFLGEGKISGEIQPEVEKKASLVYLDNDNKINASEVKQIDFHFGDVINMKNIQATPCDFSVEAK